jgi:hypothetical protein
MAGLWTPGANLTGQFDLDRYLLNGGRDAVVMEITEKAIGSDSHITFLLGRGKLIGSGVIDFVEPSTIRQREIDGDPRCKRPVRAHIRLGVEDHNDSRAVIEMGIEIPPLVTAPFRPDTLTIFKLNHTDGIDAKSLIVDGPIRQRKTAVRVRRHFYDFSRDDPPIMLADL